MILILLDHHSTEGRTIVLLSRPFTDSKSLVYLKEVYACYRFSRKFFYFSGRWFKAVYSETEIFDYPSKFPLLLDSKVIPLATKRSSSAFPVFECERLGEINDVLSFVPNGTHTPFRLNKENNLGTGTPCWLHAWILSIAPKVVGISWAKHRGIFDESPQWAFPVASQNGLSQEPFPSWTSISSSQWQLGNVLSWITIKKWELKIYSRKESPWDPLWEMVARRNHRIVWYIYRLEATERAQNVKGSGGSQSQWRFQVQQKAQGHHPNMPSGHLVWGSRCWTLEWRKQVISNVGVLFQRLKLVATFQSSHPAQAPRKHLCKNSSVGRWS